uniref:phosphoribosylformylglycinamidine cyclo-ligase n=1 Tax=Chromera velia CCMP2878 TaxID=1169474 RepID=A0A0G4GNE6_9ALVE|mmetsp:Transcript_33964/g.67266  ORF Transcript_33964/g.67266 Transcript_33964/m.67266 type:complete len:396 (+) Transcript_33964:178-1365(+)|eukprot:Cvel_22674.t1-p1 / transcript=Cvel_22674.t1 / gene=Cvel_22674 / organism=Chromera_velia_CCMP2878 / gene_product=Phosphoribosylformylglycinamidine cyclo-ligase, putative / transcript_product=Phosphoribosylformylglycinamidine cyclo-ligase, putative / location=Cvel_scaffold2254:19486-24819(+) / protein_length=395 / sequence_SO=supercontig / SO=protein_coding / is_pseudo=false
MTDTRYADRGVSHQKEDVHAAIANLDVGLFPSAFCKVVPDFLTGDPEKCIVMHADGAGTKSVIAYMYWKETGDLSVFKGISMDAIVMNTDDLICVGAIGPMLLSNTIGRNAKNIPGEVLKTIIEANEAICAKLTSLGTPIITTGGETADVGDLVRTLIVDSTVLCLMKRAEVIANDRIAAGNVIVGLSSTGQTTYEEAYNSGIGSNGLTMARHELLHKSLLEKFPESCDPNVKPELVYSGPFKLTDPLEGTPLNVGQALLSPTRTYAPIVAELLNSHRSLVTGIVHCSGGGQTKCLRFGSSVRYRKNNLFPCPPLFKAIQKACSSSWKEMYQVFNMGHRLEIYGPPELVAVLSAICQKYKLDCQQVGVVEKSDSTSGKNQVIVQGEFGEFSYEGP